MQEKSSKARSLLLQEIRSNTSYFRPAIKNGWIIKFSVHKNSDVLLIITSKYTGQTIIRYFLEEDTAVKFINFVTSRDATVVSTILWCYIIKVNNKPMH